MSSKQFIHSILTVIFLLVTAIGSAAAKELWDETIPAFGQPVYGVGSGMNTLTGSANHKNADVYAIDYECDCQGEFVYPTLPGRVVFSGWDKDYGYTVVVRHWDDSRWSKKYYSVYAHLLPEDRASLWDIVDQRWPIGRIGVSGSGSNGIVHLHFAVRSSNSVYDKYDALYGVGQQAFNVRPYLRASISD